MLRCKCGKQSYEDDPLPIAPACPRYQLQMKYSADWYIKVSVNGKRRIQAVGRQMRQVESMLKQAHTELYQKKFFEPEANDSPLLSTALETVWILTRRKATESAAPWTLGIWQVDRIWKWLRKEMNHEADKSFLGTLMFEMKTVMVPGVKGIFIAPCKRHYEQGVQYEAVFNYSVCFTHSGVACCRQLR